MKKQELIDALLNAAENLSKDAYEDNIFEQKKFAGEVTQLESVQSLYFYGKEYWIELKVGVGSIRLKEQGE